ncbi:hypothetical protein [Prochlorococcus marinus]|uniref:Uncharacterized protein n=1 Tax=Prochlorococcus marinus (strain MIT 9211) TaxID=93059 RepID=A9BC02_PROM4|nr:hypothetical protein [Prochlorococcus marinus]ABX09364.1 Hypothetical protein P9211_14331 [Prochlorococcus marinus str. MIT 9211]
MFQSKELEHFFDYSNQRLHARRSYIRRIPWATINNSPKAFWLTKAPPTKRILDQSVDTKVVTIPINSSHKKSF